MKKHRTTDECKDSTHGYLYIKGFSRQHAEVWEENNKVRTSRVAFWGHKNADEDVGIDFCYHHIGPAILHTELSPASALSLVHRLSAG